jgi:hypothetical protein
VDSVAGAFTDSLASSYADSLAILLFTVLQVGSLVVSLAAFHAVSWPVYE